MAPLSPNFPSISTSSAPSLTGCSKTPIIRQRTIQQSLLTVMATNHRVRDVWEEQRMRAVSCGV